jgi:uncharacterized protein (DUF2235 family)
LAVSDDEIYGGVASVMRKSFAEVHVAFAVITRESRAYRSCPYPVRRCKLIPKSDCKANNASRSSDLAGSIR